MIRAGIIGGAGYTAGELIRLLVNHPQVEIAFVHSTSNAGNLLTEVHAGLEGETSMRFCAEYDLAAADVVFLCSAHGQSRTWLAEQTLPEGLRIIDLAQDFRDESEGFVYGQTCANTDRVIPCEEPLAAATSTHWLSPEFELRLKKAKESGVFYFWGHSYEMKDDPLLWARYEAILRALSSDPEAVWVDVMELFQERS